MTAVCSAGPGVVALVGPSASGKSELALKVARSLSVSVGGPGRSARGIELVSVDSMAVYRGMDIGTDKPTPETRASVPYHLIDLVEASMEFSVQQFQWYARQALSEIASRGHGALLVGGTGLHLRSVVDDLSFPGRFPEVADRLVAQAEAGGPPGSPGELAVLRQLHHRLAAVDPVGAKRVDPTNRRRLIRALEVFEGEGRPFSSFGPGLEQYPPTAVRMVGLSPDPAELDRRIASRLEAMMEAGFLDEVRRLRQLPGGLSRTARQAVGYRELLSHFEGGVSLGQAIEEILRRTRSLARRQRAWFRRDPRIVWLTPQDDPIAQIIDLFG